MFNIDDKTRKEIDKWQNSFKEENVGAIGGRFTYEITPTGLGLIIKVRDNVTKQEKDFTDYENW